MLSIRQEVRLVLQGECATARDHEQEAIVAQMSIEARLTVLERRVQDSEESVSMSPEVLFSYFAFMYSTHPEDYRVLSIIFIIVMSICQQCFEGLSKYVVPVDSMLPRTVKVGKLFVSGVMPNRIALPHCDLVMSTFTVSLPAVHVLSLLHGSRPHHIGITLEYHIAVRSKS